MSTPNRPLLQVVRKTVNARYDRFFNCLRRSEDNHKSKLVYTTYVYNDGRVMLYIPKGANVTVENSTGIVYDNNHPHTEAALIAEGLALRAERDTLVRALAERKNMETSNDED